LNGFTLLELLVAMALSALVVLGAGMALKLALDSWNRGGEPERRLVAFFRAMTLMERQLRYTSGLRCPFKRGRGFFTAEGDELVFMTNLSPLSMKGGPVVVKYSLQDGELTYREIPYTSPTSEDEVDALLGRTKGVTLVQGVEGTFSAVFPEGSRNPYFPTAIQVLVAYQGKSYSFYMPVQVVP